MPAIDKSKFFRPCSSDTAETVIHSADAFAPVGYLRFTDMHTESKDSVSPTSSSTSEINCFSMPDQ